MNTTINLDHVMANAAVSTPQGVEYLVGAVYRGERGGISHVWTAPTLRDEDDRITEYPPGDVRLIEGFPPA